MATPGHFGGGSTYRPGPGFSGHNEGATAQVHRGEGAPRAAEPRAAKPEPPDHRAREGLRSSNSNPITCSGAPSARVLLVRAHLLVAYYN
jgi:hypothetical protein